MKKYNSYSESDFLKLLFGFLTAAFLVGAVAMPDRGSMFSGLWQIVSQPSKISTNYFAVGGFAATFLNMGLVCACFLALMYGLKATATNVTTLGFILTLGFSSWGINVINMWPSVLGVFAYSAVKKQKPGANCNAMLFSTGIAPIITEMMVRYPHAEYVGFTPVGILLGLAVGMAIGFFLPAGLPHAPNVHKGFDLYSAAVPVGVTAFFLNAMLYKTMGVALPAAPDAATLQVASRALCNAFCIVLFGACIAGALAMGCTFREYARMILGNAFVGNVSGTCGNAVLLMNVGVYGLFILAYFNAIGTAFNAITFGIVFCMLACCNSGSNPRTVWPIMLGYLIGSFVFGGLSSLAGGSFGGAIGAQAIAVGLCFANGLSPISGRYGWQYGTLAGLMHYVLVTSVPNLHGGYCLYNGGLTAAFICLLLVPILEKFTKTKA